MVGLNLIKFDSRSFKQNCYSEIMPMFTASGCWLIRASYIGPSVRNVSAHIGQIMVSMSNGCRYVYHRPAPVDLVNIIFISINSMHVNQNATFTCSDN